MGMRQGRRACSDEGKWEFQELTSECVLTTPICSLVHKHYTFKYVQDRHVNRRPWKYKSSCSPVSPKKPLCKDIFVYANVRSYIFMTYENVSGSFETLSSCRNVRTLHELVCVMKVVTGSQVLIRAWQIYENKKVYSHMNFRVHTRNETRSPSWTRRTTSAASVSRIPRT